MAPDFWSGGRETAAFSLREAAQHCCLRASPGGYPPCSPPSPGHLQARQEKGETNLISICVRRWRRAENLDLDPLAHCGHVHNTATPPPAIFQLGLGNILPIDALAMDVRTEEGTRGGEKGKVPVQCSPLPFKAPTQHCPAPGGPLVTHILLLQGSRLQEKWSPQPAGRCLLKEESPAGHKSQGKCCLLLSALLHKTHLPPTPAAGTWINKGKATR